MTHQYMELKIKELEKRIEALVQEPSREFEDYENEIEDLHNRLDIAEYDKERLREEVTNLEAKIKALEQEPYEDAISRQAVHIELEKWINYGEYNYSNATKYLYDRIDRLPPVNPQPKTGHWISRPHIYGVAFCSKCGFELKINNTKYCPNCGAKMETEEEA